MEKDITKLVFDLKDALDDSKEVKELNEAEKLMENDDEAMALSYRFSVAQTEYSDMLKIYSKDSPEVNKALKNLYEAKKNLDLNPKVQDYLHKYSLVRRMYQEINDKLLEKFSHKCESLIKDEEDI